MKSSLSAQQIDRIFNILPGEGFLVRNLFFHNFFQGTGIAFFFTAANALFLNQFSVKYLPWIYVLSALLLMASGRLFAYFEHRLQLKSLMNYVVWVLILFPILFYMGLTFWQYAWVVFLVMAFHRVLYTLNSLEFWGLSALAFDVRQSKRLFPLIGAGDIPAKLLGYLLVPLIVPYIGTEALLLLASGSFILSFYFLNLLLKYEEDTFKSEDPYPDFSIKSSVHADIIWKSLFKSRYLFWISVFAIAGMFTLTLIDFSFLSEVKDEFKTKEDLARFFGMLFSIGYALTIFVKFFISGRIIESLGVAHAAFILPVFLLLSGIVAVLTGIFSTDQSIMLWIFSGIYVGKDILRYSIDDPNMMTLFQPLSKSLRLFGHTLIKSVMQPIGLLLTGILLLITLNVEGSIELIYVCALLIAASGLLIILTDRVNYHYVVQLQEAIRTRYFEGSSLSLYGEQTLNTLENRLGERSPREVIHSLELLSRKPPDHWADILKSVLKHESFEVRTFALRLIHQGHLIPLSDRVLERLKNDPAPEVRKEAIRAIPNLAPDHIDRIYPYLDDENRTVRMHAYIALLDSGNLGAVVHAGQELLDLMESEDPDDRSFICKVLGELGQHNDYRFLLHLLDDIDRDVRKHAILASAGVRHPSLLSRLFSLLDENEHVPELIDSISQFGEDAVSYVQKLIRSDDTSVHMRVICSRILGKIASEQSDTMLLQQLHHDVVRVRNSALYALQRKEYRARDSDTEAIDRYLRTELDLAFHILHAELQCDPGQEIMLDALIQERKKIEHRILIALEFQYDPVRMRRARESLFDPSEDLRAKAIELFEYELPKSLYHPLELIFGKNRQDEHLKRYAKLHPATFTYPENWRAEILRQECRRYSRWTVAAAIHTLQDENEMYFALVEELTDHSSNLISEEAQRYISSDKQTSKQMKTPSRSEQHLLQIEKVLLLKSTNMFQQIPEHILVDVADIAKEVELAGGESLFKKGDFGDRMYIIVSGVIEIHDGTHVFSRLSQHDIFGELALLDPEPRSASATAEEDCLLLFIDQDPFYELMSSHPEVAKGILTILGRRLRSQNEEIVRMKQEIND